MATRAERVKANATYQLKITLDGIAPPIWRRVLVPRRTTLRRMHGVIQKSMGWANSHLHMFMDDGRIFARPDPAGEMYCEDDSRFGLHEFLCKPATRSLTNTTSAIPGSTPSFSRRSWRTPIPRRRSSASAAPVPARPRTAGEFPATRTFSRRSSIPCIPSTARCGAGRAKTSIRRSSTWPRRTHVLRRAFVRYRPVTCRECREPPASDARRRAAPAGRCGRSRRAACPRAPSRTARAHARGPRGAACSPPGEAG